MISDLISEYLEQIESKLDLVESFKRNQISQFIALIDAKISKTLINRKVSSTYETLSKIEFNDKIAQYFDNKRNKEGVPFTNFATEPDNITQIKKVINALYYAQLVFKDLENLDIRKLIRSLYDVKSLYSKTTKALSDTKDLRKLDVGKLIRTILGVEELYSKTIHEAYEASFLLTHLDVDIKDMFSEELALIQPLIAQLEPFFNTHSATTKEMAKQLKITPLSYKAGEVTSIAIDQMKPNSGDLDINLLTQFSADLPGYIDKITNYISQYSPTIIERAPNLKKEKIEELQNTALKLLNDLEHIKGNSLFLSFKALNYIHILRNILTLSMSTLEQIGNLNDSSQDFIRDKLSTLKYSVLPNLFALVDKIEDNSMLKPGALSTPLMKKIKPFYQTLIYYASKPVNFAKKGKELTNIEDSRFLALRLERTYKRIDVADKALFKIKKVQKALDEFYTILQSSEYKDKALHQLPQAIKNQLIEQYKILKPYMMKVDFNFNAVIIQSLNSNKNPSSFVTSSYRWLKGQLPADHINFVLNQKEALQTLLTKKIKTQEFHKDLNKELIESVQKTADLILFPYNEPKNIFVIDESEAVSSLPCTLIKLFEAPTPAEMNDFSDSRYILTEKELYYYNKLTNTLKLIETDAIQRKKLIDLSNILTVTLTDFELEQITAITQYSPPKMPVQNLFIIDEPQTLTLLDMKDFPVPSLVLTKTGFYSYKKSTSKSENTLELIKTDEIQRKGLSDLFNKNDLVKLAKSQLQEITTITQYTAPDSAHHNIFVMNDSKVLTLSDVKYFRDSSHILTKTGFYYYNKVKNTLDLITTDTTQLQKLSASFYKNDLVALTETQLQQITAITEYHPPSEAPQNIIVIDESRVPTLSEVKDFRDSSHILTKSGFYYYNKLDNTLQPIKTNETQLKKLSNLFCKNKIVKLTESQLQQITTITKHSHPILQFTKNQKSEKEFRVDIEHNLLTNPERLSTDQALDLSQWYKNKHSKFMIARDAYFKFIELLNLQNLPPNNTLDLEHLDKSTKAQCRNLYNLFQPYFVSSALETEYKEVIAPFDNYVTYALSIPDTPAINLFTVLETNALTSFTPAQKLAYDEFMALLKQHPVTDIQPFNFTNLPEPIKTKCRNLYNLFQPQFVKILGENANCEKAIRDLDRTIDYKDQISTFNNYVIFSLSDEVPPAKPKNLFGKLSDYVQTKFTAIDLNWNKKRDTYLKIANDKFFAEYEATQLTPEISSNARVHHLITHTNYSKAIKKFRTSLNEIISYLNEPMQKSLAIAKNGLPFPELEHAQRAVAENQILAQNNQVLALKRIFNSLYHIEGIVIQLENLDNTQYETVYVYYLLQAYTHFNEILKLSQNLVKDPYLGLIAHDVLDKAQTMLATVQEQSDAYQMSHVDVATPGSVQINGLWYTLNTFFVMPQHIRSLSNNTYLTTEELQEVHIKAKQSTLRIEAIIKNSHSYFKLFLQAPDMYHLYQDMTNKLNEFISTSHDTVMDNLGKIRAEFITPMLIEADKWEDKLGLKPGSISDTLKNITDEYFKGLLLHLNLSSKTHIALVTDKAPLVQRNTITNKQIEDATKQIAQLEKDYAAIETLFKCLTIYEKQQKELLESFTTSQEDIKQSRAELIAAYKKAQPDLAQVQKTLGQPFNNNSANMINYQKALTELINLQRRMDDPHTNTPQLALDYKAALARIDVLKHELRFELRDKQDLKYDILLNTGIDKYDSILTQIYPLISSSYHYYLGLKATSQMQLATAQEKLKHLTELGKIQEKANTQFILEYTTNSFDTEMKKVADRPIGLQYLHEEYKVKLAQFLLQFKDQLISESLKAEDKNASIRNLLKNKTELFEKNNQAEFRQLDAVGMALDQFRLYFNQANLSVRNGNSIFEDVETLDKKTAYINQLDKIAKNSTLAIKTRFEQINHIVVKNPNFARVILAHKEEKNWSFTYLIHCFLSLLEAIHLYTPASKSHYNNLHDTVRRFNFFTPPQAPGVAAPPEPNGVSLNVTGQVGL